ncbi:EscV/YscV/HrcV family type III secretion system export apparatus protein (plasmid) [Escherichia coli]|uniref:EscV/YscV/HrcV family type III secretion system export apparatus protein n=1 Tax=Escherichia coli TaxID=562 RepID=UPI001861CE4F|nr:EscV/YscV/HrcV family type III secretion system export apparatus protein [Escherichia coli]EHX4454123.1 EscV/YscV/HrcV family type III secretion system export apparatus protein [Escherichia coli]QMQ25101.1 EscV/YscV/HrcV family type III secretion system export apparatus protein [Escherichia coli]HCP8973492.1 EscV/YscV/HrcV family type III secretion system export apparatus protein [Escherichia coli]
MIQTFLKNVSTKPELIILVLMVMIIAMLIIPLPTYLVDFLIGLNIVLAILVFMGSFYIDRILSFSTFPSVLLITTLFRLALSISTSRLILVDADAGEIITTFGQFVIGESLAVGFVIFSIVTVVQFIVITKGSERVAEVAARFSLDGMPGKQMSIDADLKAGIIDAAGAKERRSVLERESQLYGSFDGAMKFIKGDAIAGIIIIFVNLIGGISVGMSQHGMSVSGALSTYTILTIGDGLVSQIPALLISISAGFIVTRVNGDSDNMGRNIMSQIFGDPFVLIVTSVLALAIGMLPGFPFFVFFLIAITLTTLFYYKRIIVNKDSSTVPDGANFSGSFDVDNSQDSSLAMIENLDSISSETVPLILLFSEDATKGNDLDNLIERVRSQFFIDYGVRLPTILHRVNNDLKENEILLLINEVRADNYNIYFNKFCITDKNSDVQALDIPVTTSVYDDREISWIDVLFTEKLANIDVKVKSSQDEFYHQLSLSLLHNINEFFGIQETKNMIDQFENRYPDLVKEVLRHVTIQRISEVLQRLLAECISVRNLKLVMESLALWAPREKDVITLVEHVRSSLSRYICSKIAVAGEIKAVMLSSYIEDAIRKGVRQTSGGAFLNMDIEVSDEIMETLAHALSELRREQKDFVLLVSVDIRRFVKRLIDNRFRNLAVISYAEIDEVYSVNVIKTI